MNTLTHTILPCQGLVSLETLYTQNLSFINKFRGGIFNSLFFFIILANWNTKRVNLQDMYRSIMMALEVAMIEPKTQVGGVHVILNMQGLTLNHVWQFSASFAKLVVDFVQECTPVRLKGVHIINQPYIFDLLYKLFRPFLGEKLRSRVRCICV